MGDPVSFHYLGVVEFEHGLLVGGRPDERLDIKQITETNASSSTTATTEEESRSVEERIIDQLDYAQLCGDIIRRPGEDTKLVTVDVSTNGVKFVAQEDQRVVERLAMHKILQSLSYENEIGSCNVAIVVTRTDSNLVCHLLQTENHDDADQLCQKILEAFQSIETEAANEKSRVDRERRRQELEHRRQRKNQQNSTTQ